MKKIVTLVIVCLAATACFAQAPQFMNYQAVARNNAGAALANQTIKVRLSVIKNAVLQYSETRQVTTNVLGLFNVQIGSSGTLSSTGTFSAIDWQNNAAPGYVLKVELDINNSGLFTDMGSTAFSSVPFAFVTDKAIEAENAEKIGGRSVDAVTTPAVGSRLVWNGAAWTPVKKDSVIAVASTGATIVAGSSNAPWAFAGNAVPTTITVTGNETIIATFVSAFGHNTVGGSVNVSASICYQNTSGGAITEVNTGFYPQTTIPDLGGPAEFNMTMITVTGAVKLPAGTYKIGMGIKNKSTSINLNNNGHLNGVIEIRH